MNTKRARAYLINPDLFDDKQWFELFHAIPADKAQRIGSTNREFAAVPDFTNCEIRDLISACENKAQLISAGAYGPGTTEIDLSAWAETLTECAEILKGIITK